MDDKTDNVVALDFAPRAAESIEPRHNTHTAFLRVPPGTPVTIIERSDWGPWWSAIAGAIGFNALIFMLALIIMR